MQRGNHNELIGQDGVYKHFIEIKKQSIGWQMIGDEMGDVVIDFDNVSFSYGTQTEGSLRNINFKVKEGEFILLTGQSGSGKTTVTRLINGLIPHFFEGVLTGTVKVLGSDIKTITPGEMGKNIASIFQNPRSQFFYNE